MCIIKGLMVLLPGGTTIRNSEVAPLKSESYRNVALFFMFFLLENAHGCADCVNQRVNRVNHSKRSLLQVESAE